MDEKLFLLELQKLIIKHFGSDSMEDWDCADFKISGRDNEMEMIGERHITSGVVYNIPSDDPYEVGRFTEGKFAE